MRSESTHVNYRPKRSTAIVLATILIATPVRAQGPTIRYGTKVSADVKRIYQRGLEYLIRSQQQDGSWVAGDQNGITGLCVLAFLADGEDPNFGAHAIYVRKGIERIVRSQDARTGYIPNSMYNHGFATLALAEAYGSVDDRSLTAPRSIGTALELAVRCALTSQRNNRLGGWRYAPEMNDADTSVSGAVLMGLLAARNAGIEVPDTAVDRAVRYYRNSTSDTGTVAYSGGIGGLGESMNRSAVATLVFALTKERDTKEYQATLGYITSRLDHQDLGYPYYFRYYMAQALFQGDFQAWTRWERDNVHLLRDLQQEDGSFQANHGPAYGTAMALLSVALEFRFLPIYER